MDRLKFILTRRTEPRLVAPGPDQLEICALLECAATAPDHGRLRPWKFVVVHGEQRHRLGCLLTGALLQRTPGASTQAKRTEYEKAFRAPTTIVVATQYRDHPGVPQLEQYAAAVCATQNILLAANALGFGTMWKTGAAAQSDLIKSGLDIGPSNHIVGFLHIGHMDTEHAHPRENRREPDYLDQTVWLQAAQPRSAPIEEGHQEHKLAEERGDKEVWT